MSPKKYYAEPADESLLDPQVRTQMNPKVGVLLVNLGTPSAPTAQAIRRYLAEFLSDQRVVEIAPLVWQVILRGVILPFRPKKLVSKYKSIWLSRALL